MRCVCTSADALAGSKLIRVTSAALETGIGSIPDGIPDAGASSICIPTASHCDVCLRSFPFDNIAVPCRYCSHSSR